MKYFAYGMNTNIDSMEERCLGAKVIGYAMLPGYRFDFKRHATVSPDIDEEVHGVLWEINETDELMLDMLEGYPTYYTKQFVTVLYQDRPVTAMTYMMHDDAEPAMPTTGYFRMVQEGYHQNNVPTDQLYDAITRINLVDIYA